MKVYMSQDKIGPTPQNGKHYVLPAVSPLNPTLALFSLFHAQLKPPFVLVLGINVYLFHLTTCFSLLATNKSASCSQSHFLCWHSLAALASCVSISRFPTATQTVAAPKITQSSFLSFNIVILMFYVPLSAMSANSRNCVRKRDGKLGQCNMLARCSQRVFGYKALLLQPYCKTKSHRLQGLRRSRLSLSLYTAVNNLSIMYSIILKL